MTRPVGHKRPDGRWEVSLRFEQHGRPKRRSFYGVTLREAVAKGRRSSAISPRELSRQASGRRSGASSSDGSATRRTSGPARAGGTRSS